MVDLHLHQGCELMLVMMVQRLLHCVVSRSVVHVTGFEQGTGLC